MKKKKISMIGKEAAQLRWRKASIHLPLLISSFVLSHLNIDM